MRRRLLLGGAAALSLRAVGSDAAQPRRLAVLFAVKPSPEYNASLAAFEQALAGRGWRKDDNLTIDVHWSTGDAQHRREAIAAVLAMAPDVVLVQSEAVTAAMMEAGGRFPVVFLHVADPVRSGLVGGLARPEGRLTGLTNTTPTMAAKWLQLLREAAPGTRRVVLLFNPETAAVRGAVFLDPFLAAGRTLGVTTSSAEVRSPGEIDASLASLAASPGGGFVAAPDPFMASNSTRIVEQAAKLHLPAVYPYRYYAAQGGLISYGVDNVELYRQSADYVDRLLRGSTPADLPIQQPTRFRLTVNLKAARGLGLELPPTLVAEADEVLE
ncbi:MAG: ABC transporter substrate-binding protein [Proteobacteria bacterium]|nr:ABC transporter substrate-binding protein [Pseudomonadota bacterium]